MLSPPFLPHSVPFQRLNGLVFQSKAQAEASHHPSGLCSPRPGCLYLVGPGLDSVAPLLRESVEWPVIPEAGISSKSQKEPDVTWLPAQLLQAQTDPWSPR